MDRRRLLAAMVGAALLLPAAGTSVTAQASERMLLVPRTPTVTVGTTFRMAAFICPISVAVTDDIRSRCERVNGRRTTWSASSEGDRRVVRLGDRSGRTVDITAVRPGRAEITAEFRRSRTVLFRSIMPVTVVAEDAAPDEPERPDEPDAPAGASGRLEIERVDLDDDPTTSPQDAPGVPSVWRAQRCTDGESTALLAAERGRTSQGSTTCQPEDVRWEVSPPEAALIHPLVASEAVVMPLAETSYVVTARTADGLTGGASAFASGAAGDTLTFAPTVLILPPGGVDGWAISVCAPDPVGPTSTAGDGSRWLPIVDAIDELPTDVPGLGDCRPIEDPDSVELRLSGEGMSLDVSDPLRPVVSALGQPSLGFVVGEADGHLGAALLVPERTTTCPPDTSLAGDLDGDRRVDFTDIAALRDTLFRDGSDEPLQVPDLNDDGVVNTADLVFLLSDHLGRRCESADD